MRSWSLVLVAFLASSGHAEPKKPGKGFWKVLVKKGAKGMNRVDRWPFRPGTWVTSEADL
jgi:hypothetical protein